MQSKHKKYNHSGGFTLVELIIVLVILAILAAFTIPAMLGFVEDAKSKASVTLAREVYTAAQSAATEIYAKYGDFDLKNGTGAKPNTNIDKFKEDIGNKIKDLTADDIGFTKVINGNDGQKPGDAKENFIEVAIKYRSNDGS